MFEILMFFHNEWVIYTTVENEVTALCLQRYVSKHSYQPARIKSTQHTMNTIHYAI